MRRQVLKFDLFFASEAETTRVSNILTEFSSKMRDRDFWGHIKTHTVQNSYVHTFTIHTSIHTPTIHTEL